MEDVVNLADDEILSLAHPFYINDVGAEDQGRLLPGNDLIPCVPGGQNGSGLDLLY